MTIAKGKRAKGVQMTEQQPTIPQVAQDIVEMPPTADIVQMPANVSDWSISFVTSYLIEQSFCVSIGQLFMKLSFLIGSFSSILIGG
jgi:hypothetical protein